MTVNADKKMVKALPTITRIVAAYLDTDPEIADSYLWRFFKAFGNDTFRALLKWVSEAAIKNADVVIVTATLEHDLAEGVKKADLQFRGRGKESEKEKHISEI